MTNTLLFLILFILLSGITATGQPEAAFIADRHNICSGTSLSLINTSNGAHAFEWKIDGAYYANSRDTSVILVEPCYDRKEIKLTATDTINGLRDSAILVVEVFDTCFFHWTGDFIRCPGDTVQVDVHPEEVATSFVITPSQALLSGCLSCPALSFIMPATQVFVDRTSSYFGGCSEITSYHYFCHTIATEEETIPETPRIYPVPAHQSLRVESQDEIGEIWIYDLQRRAVIRVENINDREKEMDISRLAPGIFFIHIILHSQSTSVQKFVKN